MRTLLAVFLLLAWPSAARAVWREASTPHFVIYSEESADSLRAFATRLERFDGAMRVMRGVPDPQLGPSNRLTIYAVSNIATVQKMMGKGSRNVAGFYSPRAGGSIAVVPRRTGAAGKYDMSAQAVLLHEYSHHFMMAEDASVAYPAWLVEGSAEFNSTAEFGDDGSITLGKPAYHRAYGLLAVQMPVERLLASTANLASAEATEGFYARGWLLTHYLSFEPSRRGQLTAYVRAINSGKDGLQAARDVFGDLKILDKALNAYVQRKRLKVIQFKPAELKLGEIRIRELSAAENATMALRMQSNLGVNEAEAQALAPRMRKAVAAYPDDASAQAYLAEAEYDAGNLAEAGAAADRALAKDPKHVDGLIYKGRVLLAKATAEKSRNAKTWREARNWLLKANKVDPEHAEPLQLFYGSFLAAGEKPTANAVTALNYAHVLAPQDRTLRMLVARQYLLDRKLAEAKVALAPIAYDPHGGAGAKLATALLSLLASGDAEAALKAWQAGADGSEKSAEK